MEQVGCLFRHPTDNTQDVVIRYDDCRWQVCLGYSDKERVPVTTWMAVPEGGLGSIMTTVIDASRAAFRGSEDMVGALRSHLAVQDVR